MDVYSNTQVNLAWTHTLSCIYTPCNSRVIIFVIAYRVIIFVIAYHLVIVVNVGVSLMGLHWMLHLHILSEYRSQHDERTPSNDPGYTPDL